MIGLAAKPGTAGTPNMLDRQHKETESGMQARALLLEGRRPNRIVI